MTSMTRAETFLRAELLPPQGLERLFAQAAVWWVIPAAASLDRAWVQAQERGAVWCPRLGGLPGKTREVPAWQEEVYVTLRLVPRSAGVWTSLLGHVPGCSHNQLIRKDRHRPLPSPAL